MADAQVAQVNGMRLSWSSSITGAGDPDPCLAYGTRFLSIYPPHDRNYGVFSRHCGPGMAH